MGLARGGLGGGGLRWRLEDWRDGDAEDVAKRAQGAGGRLEGGGRGGGEGGQGFGVAQEVFELRAVAGHVIAEGGDQPGAGAGEAGAGEAGAGEAGGGRGGFAARLGRAGAREAAGGQQGEEIGQAAAGAGEAVAQAGGEVAEGVDTAEEEQADGRKYPVQPRGQLGGQARWGGMRCVHDLFLSDPADRCKRVFGGVAGGAAGVAPGGPATRIGARPGRDRAGWPRPWRRRAFPCRSACRHPAPCAGPPRSWRCR